MDCAKLSDVSFEPGYKASVLGKSAFSGCTSLQSIWIPSSIEIISQLCFNNCRKLESIVLEAGWKLSPESISSLSSKWDVTWESDSE
jgi:hypothetical protein